MKGRGIAILLGIALLLGGGWLWFRTTPVGQIVAMLNTPIEFYGKVVDQNGDPVPNANVDYGLLDKFNASGSVGKTSADKNGFITISGVRGAAITVSAYKEGYYQIHNVSSETFAYGYGPDSTTKPRPTKDNPAVFVLHKMGTTEPLLYVGTRYFKVSKDGQPLEVNLDTGRQAPAGQGDIRFERWANDQEKDSRGRFDWRFRIIVPGGGLAERNGEFDFEAPEDGYEESVEINMPASLGEDWSNTVNRSFFVKLRDGRYARFSATIKGANDNPTFRSDAYVNPKPGSRNLEYDRNQPPLTGQP